MDLGSVVHAERMWGPLESIRREVTTWKYEVCTGILGFSPPSLRTANRPPE